MTLLRRSGFLLATAALFLTAACGGDESPATSGDPVAALQEAKDQFDAASSVYFTMRTTSRPDSGDAVLGATGTLTRQPAFEGSVKAHISGIDAEVPIVVVDGTVYAKLPLTLDFAPIDPSDYGAPNPADFIDPARGISGLLLELDGLEAGDQVREGKQVLSTYEGTLTGDLVAPIIPSADADGSYRTVVGIDEDGRIATLSVTGAFFESSGDVTYTLRFEDYGKDVTVTAP